MNKQLIKEARDHIINSSESNKEDYSFVFDYELAKSLKSINEMPEKDFMKLLAECRCKLEGGGLLHSIIKLSIIKL